MSGPSTLEHSGVAVVLPIKSFRIGWTRLAGRLEPATRSRLAELVAGRVASAVSAFAVTVVTDDPEVMAWARGRDLSISSPPRAGLNAAVRTVLAELECSGTERAVVIHGDLPLARSIDVVFEPPDDVVIVTDRHGDGTNVMSVPLGRGVLPAYGVGSAQRHAVAMRRLGLTVAVIRHDELSWDLDTPDDLDHPELHALIALAGQVQ